VKSKFQKDSLTLPGGDLDVTSYYPKKPLKKQYQIID
jgi:hypothetical protein